MRYINTFVGFLSALLFATSVPTIVMAEGTKVLEEIRDLNSSCPP